MPLCKQQRKALQLFSVLQAPDCLRDTSCQAAHALIAWWRLPASQRLPAGAPIPTLLPPPTRYHPTQDVYLRRVTAVLGSRSSAGGQRIAVNFAVAGQLDEFRQVGAAPAGCCATWVLRKVGD